MKKRVAFVVQRCGLEVNGGSELLCRLIADRLAEHYETEVLTTCALDYLTWANHYPAGEQRLGNLLIRRFRVARPRDLDSFNLLSQSVRLRLGKLTVEEEEGWMRKQGPWTPELFDYLRHTKHDYHAFIFFTYLYATTYFGLPLVADKAVLVPTAHDEWPIHLRIWDRVMQLPRAFAFLSGEELAFLRRRFPTAALNGPVVGLAVEPPVSTDPNAFRKAHRMENPFVLYLGRLDESKGLHQLLNDFGSYQETTGDWQTELALVGHATMKVPSRPGVRVLGYLSEQQKWDALAACEALVVPSPYESLSIVCLEAWSIGKPVLVTARSNVLVGQCRRSQGGLWYRDTDEFCAGLECLLREPVVQRGLGAQGREFVRANYHWPQIIEAYSELLAAFGN
jgi:glycosyltransferase involved in cell wall biosynthesis